MKSTKTKTKKKTTKRWGAVLFDRIPTKLKRRYARYIKKENLVRNHQTAHILETYLDSVKAK